MFSMSPKHTFIRPNVTGTYKTIIRPTEPQNFIMVVVLFIGIICLGAGFTYHLNKQAPIPQGTKTGSDGVYKTIGTALSLYPRLERGEQICSKNEDHLFGI